MTTSDERLKVLQMLDDGRITVEDAAALLRALGADPAASPDYAPSGSTSRFIRVHVTDLDSGESKVDVTLPLTMVKAGLGIAERFAPGFEGFDLDNLEQTVFSGATGKLVEVNDSEDREGVEIYIG